MKKLTYEVKLTVEVNAFEETDADDMMEDAFGVGAMGEDAKIVKSKFKVTDIEQPAIEFE